MKGGPILIVWDRLGDYHRARVEALRQRCPDTLVLTADRGSGDSLYGWDNTAEGEQHAVLSQKPVHEQDREARVRAFWQILQRHRVRNVVLAGYGNLDYVALILAAWARGCRVVLFAESWYPGRVWLDRIKGLFLRACCDGLFVSGVRARDHFQQHLGLGKLPIETGYSVVDNDHFQPAAGRSRQRLLLCVARFSPEKDLATLIRAFRESRLAGKWRLRLIGGGPQEAELRTLASGCPGVEFAGWVGYADLPEEYGQAAWFVLPSRFEPWGLVVNEAMAAGLPVVVSDACGCQPDLVDRCNGHSFSPGNVDGLRSVLDGLEPPGSPEWEARSAASQDRVNTFSCAAWAEHLLQLLE